MIVIKHIKTTGEKIKVKYPANWPKPVEDLEKGVEIFEIKELPKPQNYDSNKHTIKEIFNLTNNKGQVYNICEIDWELSDKSKETVLLNFNNAFYKFIDAVYPIEQRIKDLSLPNDETVLRKAQEAALRELRRNSESDYINNDIFPPFNFQWL